MVLLVLRPIASRSAAGEVPAASEFYVPLIASGERSPGRSAPVSCNRLLGSNGHDRRLRLPVFPLPSYRSDNGCR